jgi:hypothetical protein
VPAQNDLPELPDDLPVKTNSLQIQHPSTTID